jgi:hypothetical protein
VLSICRITACSAIAQTSELMLDLAQVANDPGTPGSQPAVFAQIRARVDARPATAAARRAVPELIGTHVLLFADAVLLVAADGTMPTAGAMLPTLCTLGLTVTHVRAAALWPHLTATHVRAAKNTSHAYAVAAARRLTGGSEAAVSPLSWNDHIRYFTQCQIHPERLPDNGEDFNPLTAGVAARLCSVAVAVNALPPWRCGYGSYCTHDYRAVGFVTWRGTTHDVTLFCNPTSLVLVCHYSRNDVVIDEYPLPVDSDVKPYATALEAAVLRLYAAAPAELAGAQLTAPIAPDAPPAVVTGRRPRRR